MHLTLPSRRAAGLLAASTLGLSTAVLGVTGVASAAEDTFTFSTDPTADVNYSGPGASTLTMSGNCTISWKLAGGSGGAGSSLADGPRSGDMGSTMTIVTTTSGDQTFHLYPGHAGEDASDPHGGMGGHNGADLARTDGTYGITDTDHSVFGGGGGAASVVTLDGAETGPYLAAPGGAGGYTDGDSYGLGGGPAAHNSDGTPSTGTAPAAGDGVISGSYTCTPAEDSGDVTPDPGPVAAAPSAPTGLSVWAADGSLKLQFTPGDSDGSDDADEDGWEYSLDGGKWRHLAVTPDEWSAALNGEITGLSNGRTYAVRVRGTNGTGDGKPSGPVDGTPARPAGAPTDVAVDVLTGALKISWGAPQVAGTYPVGGYEVYMSAEQSGGRVCATDAGTRSCVVGAEAGHTYGIVVVSLDTHGNPGAAADSVSTGSVAFPAAPSSVPAGAGTVGTGSSGTSLKAGQDLTLTGSGYLPGSTVDLFVYSTPTKVGTAVAGADGTFTATVTLPAGLVDGNHHLVAAGVDPDGDPRYLVTAIAVSGGTAAGSPAADSPATLAYTGFSALPYVVGGLLAVVAGAGLVVASRRRTQA